MVPRVTLGGGLGLLVDRGGYFEREDERAERELDEELRNA